MKAFGLEWYKLRRKRLFLMVLLLAGVEMAWAFMAASMSISRIPDQAEWEPVVAMVASLNGLFAPILVAVCVSRICDMEHKGNTWKLLLSVSAKRGQLYAAKYGCAFLIMAGVCLAQVLAIAAFGAAHGFGQQVPFVLLARFFIGTVIAHAVVIAVQQWLSMAVKNQAFALCLGMLGGFVGMAADLFPAGIRSLLLWSYYTGLSPIAQSYANDNVQFMVREPAAGVPIMALLIAAGLVLYAAGSIHVSRQEV
ncbi:ABC transporter permease [Paenibacillus hodogayensis]|uniref:ABC transporter permease n=1 Tax=Paenibacillus hodogayensis TaxID=279208 RepID=A0ABV5VS81_9BACL